MAFRPLPRRTDAFKVQRQRSRRTASRADSRIGDDPRIPHIPLKRSYTPRERRVIKRRYKQAAKRAHVKNVLELYKHGSTRQRQQMTRVSNRLRESEALDILRADRAAGYDRPPNRAFVAPRKSGAVGGILRTATAFLPGGAATVVAREGAAAHPLLRGGRAGFEFGRAIVEEPGQTAASSLRTARESVTGIPEGIKMTVDAAQAAAHGDLSEAQKLLEMVADDYERRYGPIARGDWETFRRRIQKDYGVTPYALDAAAVASAGGAGAGAVARSSTFGSLTRLPGRAGTIAKAIHEASRQDVERPRLKFGAGEEGTRAQNVSRNLFVAGAQRKLDRRRAASHSKAVRRAGFEEGPGGQMRRVRSDAKTDRLPGLRPGPGEVVGRGARDIGPWKRLTGRVHRDIGQVKATTRLMMLTHRGRVMKEVNRVIDPLTETEQAGLALALKYGVRNDPRALEVLARRLEEIESPEARRSREEAGIEESMEAEVIRAILDDPEAYLTPRVAEAANALRDIQVREAELDPGLADDQELIRRFSQQAELLGVPRRSVENRALPDAEQLSLAADLFPEEVGSVLRQKADEFREGYDPTEKVDNPQAFVDRTRKAAEESGLAEPAYWMSVADPESGARYAAVGTGLKAAERNKEYKGGWFRTGAEDVGLETFVQGMERGIKRRFQWQMVVRNIETHAFEWSRNNGQGVTFTEAKKIMRQRRVDPASVEFLPATIVERRPEAEAGMLRGRPVDEVPEGEEFSDIHTELNQRKTFEQLASEDIQSAPAMRYFVTTKEIGDELRAATQPTGGTARMLEIILKQKPTRLMLGALNIPWLGFQVLSNGMLMGLGGGFKPWDIVGAAKWYRGLSDDEKLAIDAELGITHGHHFAMDQPHLGDTAAEAKYGVGRLVGGWRAYKKTKVGRGLHKANPLDFMFRLDEGQNNFFRKTLFYSKAKRTAYRNMGRGVRGAMDTQGDIVERVFRKPPQEQLKAITENQELFERHADHVRKWLGDYTRFSNAERKVLQGHVLFYGYLRFSLRFAFYTMPVQHPIMLNILSNIGRLGAQEIKDLFGVPSNYALPTSMLAQVYFGERRDARRGQLESVNWGRMNPFLNSITQMEAEQQVVGLVSPFAQLLVDQAFEESSFTGREWRIRGQPTPGEAERPRNYFGSFGSILDPSSPRSQIAQASLARMLFPYRVATETGIPPLGIEPLAESSSDDALLWDQEPMRYKDEEAQAGVAKSRRLARRTPFSEKLLSQLVPPAAPRPTAAPQVIKREREKERAMATRGRRKKRRSNPYGGGSSSSASRYGGSSSSGASRYGG